MLACTLYDYVAHAWLLAFHLVINLPLLTHRFRLTAKVNNATSPLQENLSHAKFGTCILLARMLFSELPLLDIDLRNNQIISNMLQDFYVRNFVSLCSAGENFLASEKLRVSEVMSGDGQAMVVLPPVAKVLCGGLWDGLCCASALNAAADTSKLALQV